MHNRRKKIGLVVDYFSFRSDMRDFIRDLSSKCDLILYISSSEQRMIEESGYKYRLISSNRYLRNILLEFFYKLFRPKHRLHKDSVEWKMRKLASPFGLKQAIQIFSFWLYELLPGLLEYDKYLTLRKTDENNVSDLSAMIFFTDIKNDSLMESCVRMGIHKMVYVYSWDHPVKLTKIPNNQTTYLVWSKEMSSDLQNIHNIEATKIAVVGSTQFSYIYEYLQEKHDFISLASEPYIYVVATKGRKEMVSQEIDMVNFVIEFLDINKLPHSVLFRPYPNMSIDSQNLVDEMAKNKRVVIDEYRGGSFIFTRDKVMDKYDKINRADLVIHTGGTFGIEACLLGKICLYFDFSKSSFTSQVSSPYYLNIQSVSKQFHLCKYLRLKNKNVISNEDLLTEALKEILVHKSMGAFSDYSRNVSGMFPTRSICGIVDEFINLIDNHNPDVLAAGI